MAETTKISFCPNIRYYLELLRGARPLRKFITLGSHRNLQKAADANPEETASLLEKLLKLRPALGMLKIPEGVSFPHNRKILAAAAEQGPEYFAGLMGITKGTQVEIGTARDMDFKKMGLRPKLNRPTLEGYLEKLDAHYEDFRRDVRERSLFLYKSILRARIDLYREGEERSVAKQEGAEPGLTPGLRKIIDFIDRLSAKIVFNDRVVKDTLSYNPYRSHAIWEFLLRHEYVDREGKVQPKFKPDIKKFESDINKLEPSFKMYPKEKVRVFEVLRRAYEEAAVKEGLKRTSELLSEKNNTAADAKMAFIFSILQEGLKRQMTRDLRIAGRDKLIYKGEGIWEVITSHYRVTKTGLVGKERGRSEVRTAKLLSMIQHVVDSCAEQIERIKVFLPRLEDVRFRLPDSINELEAIVYEFAAVREEEKDKAAIEIEGAFDLVEIGSKQALSLARSLLNLAGNDLFQRQNVTLPYQKAVWTAMGKAVEEKIEQLLNEFARQIAEVLSRPEAILEPAVMDGLTSRLWGYTTTFLKDQMREKWLRRAKSRVVGLAKDLPNIRKKLVQKRGLMDSAKKLRTDFEEEYNKIWKSAGTKELKMARVRKLRIETLSALSEKLKALTAVNAELIEKLRKGAITILSMGLDHANRHGEVVSKKDFFAGYTELLAKFDDLGGPRVDVLDSWGGVLGQALKSDADYMQLHY
jgi:hypothetical protein